MIYRKIIHIIRARFYINIFFLIGVILAGIKLENYFYETESYYYHPVQENVELVIYEPSGEEFILSAHDYEHNCKSKHIEFVSRIYSFKFTISFYNRLVENKYKTIISKSKFQPNHISVLQKKSIWHASSIEEPGIFS